MRSASLAVAVLATLLAGCGNLGIGEPSCEPTVRVPSAANILAAQSVPTARYTPCYQSFDLGWDDIDFEAEDGRAGIAVQRGTDTFLTAVVTESCEVGDATPAPSGHADIAKFERIEQVRSDITIAILPSGAAAMAHAQALAQSWEGAELEDRLVVFTVDVHTDEPIAERAASALGSNQFLWVIDELDVAENTVDLRTGDGKTFSHLRATAALEAIEELAPEPIYRGQWYFVFDGGCITYTFNAKGEIADDVAADAAENLGFYPAWELWEILEREGGFEDD